MASVKLNPTINADISAVITANKLTLSEMKTIARQYGITNAAFRKWCGLRVKAGMQCSADNRIEYGLFLTAVGNADLIAELKKRGAALGKDTTLGLLTEGGKKSKSEVLASIDGTADVPMLSLLLTKPQVVKLMKDQKESAPASLTKHELLAYAATKRLLDGDRAGIMLIESGKLKDAQIATGSIKAEKLLSMDTASSRRLGAEKLLELKTKAMGGQELTEEDIKKLGGGSAASASSSTGKKRTYKKKKKSTAARGAGSRASKYQDANGRWRYASGAKKGKFAPAPRK